MIMVTQTSPSPHSRLNVPSQQTIHDTFTFSMISFSHSTFVVAGTLFLWASTAVALSGDASISRARLQQAFASPSGKLTYSPELVIAEPTDPTAILLQTNALQTLSSKLREGKANAVFFQGSLTALRTFCNEQEQARGNFPGPVPVIYCAESDSPDWSGIAEAGAEGVLVNVCEDGSDLDSVDGLTETGAWAEKCKEALACGLQPVPELVLAETAVEQWGDAEVPALISTLTRGIGDEPIAVVVTVNPAKAEQEADDEEEDGSSEPASVSLPTVPRELSKQMPIIGSIRATAGDGRLGAEANRFKEAGFSSAFLRSECVPGFRIQLDLEIVAKFWAGCIVDLKSTKSKNFSFRSKNNMEKSVGTQWANYQKSVMDSGALGDPEESYSIVDSEAGEYKGFA